jgi:tagaturonate epimerase
MARQSVMEAGMETIAKVLLSEKCFGAEGSVFDRAGEKLAAADASLYARSACATGGNVYILKKIKRGRQLLAFTADGSAPAPGFSGEVSSVSAGGIKIYIKACDCGHANALKLREVFSFTKPATLGLKTSFGMGDRIGTATPGHIRAIREYDAAPILPQQSIREMTRTGRTPDVVMDDACWGVFQEGYRLPFGADADHLKTEEDIRYTAAAGFTFYTVDPSDHLNFAADTMSDAEAYAAFDALFADVKEKEALISRYSEKFELKSVETGSAAVFTFKPMELKRVAVKYLPAVRHTVKMYRLLLEIFGAPGRFDFEMSVDETPTPTMPKEHLFVAVALRNAGVVCQSLAPRYSGEFQKGIDFIGDKDDFRIGLELHALIARCFGPYKLSIHSGSDKFSIFPIVGEVTRGLFHEKTAGTSYLEAIRVVARRAPALYREIHRFALGRFEEDRKSYHVTTNLNSIPSVDNITDDHLEYLFDAIDPRQLIHITYGSVLTRRGADGKLVFYDRIMDVLDEYESDHYDALAAHFRHHCDSLGIEKRI